MEIGGFNMVNMVVNIHGIKRIFQNDNFQFTCLTF